MTALYAFLIAVSVPLTVPYAGLIARAFGLTAAADIWVATAVLLVSAFALVAWLAAAPRGFVRVIGVVAVVGIAGAAAAMTVGTELNLNRFDFVTRPEEARRLWRAFGNSLVLALSASAIVIVTSSLAGYYFSRFRFPLRGAMLKGLLVLHGVPVMVLIIPLFLMMHWTGMLDRLISVVFVIVALELPFAVFVMKGFFDALPWDVEMAAIVDGATRRQAFVRVMLPQAASGMAVVGVFSFIRGWEEFVFVSVFMVSQPNWTMSLFLFFQNNAPAVALFYMVPPVVAFLLTQKTLMRISIGARQGDG